MKLNRKQVLAMACGFATVAVAVHFMFYTWLGYGGLGPKLRYGINAVAGIYLGVAVPVALVFTGIIIALGTRKRPASDDKRDDAS